MKRILDITLTLLAAPVWVPVMAVVAVLVLCKLGRPVFFRQMRAGLKGKPFEIVKFRTMLNGDGPDSERLTRFGRILRATSLDELPELLLVLKGTMSLVGPRPLPVEYLERYTPEEMHRHDVKPGITGWAQVHGRNFLDWEMKFRYDLWYTINASVWLDLKILAMTVVQVFAARGVSAKGEATMGEFRKELKGGKDDS